MPATLHWRRRFSLGKTIDDSIDSTLMNKIGAWVRERIISRTLRGLDVRGHKFASYSKDYAKRKGSTHVNLELSGRMLESITVERAGPTSVKVVVEGDRRIVAETHHSPVASPLPKRQFMGLSQNQINELKAFVRKEIKSRVRARSRSRR